MSLLIYDVGMRKRDAADRFWEKVDASGECWLWTAATWPSGYGQFNLGTDSGYRNIAAHHFSYTDMVGPIPDELELDHTCRNRLCVRPSHLRPVTRKQNSENLSANSNSATGIRGVVKCGHRWRARVTHNHREYHVGYFASADEAAEAVRLKRIELFTHNDADHACQH